LLRNDNRTLEYDKKNAERILQELNELSLYESKSDLPLTIPVKVNKLCDHLASLTQSHCNSKVITVFQTEFLDDFEITTNSNALEKLLYLLLNDASSFTRKGFINLKCTENGRNVRFSVTDTGEALNENRYVNIDFNICQSISRLLHGRIWHDSEYHDGTRFIFEIPKTVTA
jgi:signal transduction histidine kinase